MKLSAPNWRAWTPPLVRANWEAAIADQDEERARYFELVGTHPSMRSVFEKVGDYGYPPYMFAVVMYNACVPNDYLFMTPSNRSQLHDEIRKLCTDLVKKLEGTPYQYFWSFRYLSQRILDRYAIPSGENCAVDRQDFLDDLFELARTDTPEFKKLQGESIQRPNTPTAHKLYFRRELERFFRSQFGSPNASLIESCEDVIFSSQLDLSKLRPTAITITLAQCQPKRP